MNLEWTVGRPQCPLLAVSPAKNLCLFLLVFSSNSTITHTHTHTQTHTHHARLSLNPPPACASSSCHFPPPASAWCDLCCSDASASSRRAISSQTAIFFFFFFFFLLLFISFSFFFFLLSLSPPQRSIEYLFPSGLFEKKARPLMKVRVCSSDKDAQKTTLKAVNHSSLWNRFVSNWGYLLVWQFFPSYVIWICFHDKTNKKQRFFDLIFCFFWGYIYT